MINGSFKNPIFWHQQETTGAGEGVENKKHCALLMEMCIGAATMETIWRFLKKLELPYDLAFLLLDIFPKKKKKEIEIYVPYVCVHTC